MKNPKTNEKELATALRKELRPLILAVREAVEEGNARPGFTFQIDSADKKQSVFSPSEVKEATASGAGISKDPMRNALRKEVRPLMLALREAIEESTARASITFVIDGKEQDHFIFKGDKGDKGDSITGPKPQYGVDYLTPKEMEKLTADILKAATPVKGKHYRNGLPGRPGKDAKITKALIAEIIKAATPVKGVHYKDGEDAKVAPPLTVEQIRNMLESLKGKARIKATAIQGLDEVVKKALNAAGAGYGPVMGAGSGANGPAIPSLGGQSGKVLSNDGTDLVWIAAGGGGGAVDSVNGQTGVVVLTTDSIAEGTAKYFSNELAQDAVGSILLDTDTIDFTYDDPTPTITANVKKQMSITSDASGLKLDGDEATPGASQYYGTDAGGAKGFYSLPSGGSPTLTEVEIDFGTITAPATSFVIADALVDATKKILVYPSPNPATGRIGNDWELDSVLFTAIAGTAQLTVNAMPMHKLIGPRKIWYQIV